MARKVLSMTRFNGGIAIGDKETITSVYNQNNVNSSYRFGTGLNIHDEPSKVTPLPASVNVLSGATGTGPIIIDEPRWFVNGMPYVNYRFMYGSSGNVYQEDSFGNWTLIHTVPTSVGNGMCVFNNYLYCTANGAISQYGPLNGNPTWNDTWQTGLTQTNALGFAPMLVFGFGFAVGHGNNIGFFGNNITVSIEPFTSYSTGTVISYGGQYYICIVAYTSGSVGSSNFTPDLDTTHWSGYNSNVPPYQWTLSAIQLPQGSYVTSLTRVEQYLAIGTTGSTSVFDNEQGYIFMWDGSSPQWNFFNNIEQGSCNAITNYRNQPLSINGSQGMIYLGYDPFQKVHQLPFLPISGRVQVYPGAITSWKGKVYIGFGAQSTDQNFTRGVYAWGAKVNAYLDALSCDYTISTGNTGNTVQITACCGMGNSLYIGWRDGNTVGVDKVTYSNNPGYARINFMVFDDGRVPQQKLCDRIQVYHSTLLPGQSVQIFYRVNRSDNASYPFATTPALTHTYSASDTNPTVTYFSPQTSDLPLFNELEIGVGLVSSTAGVSVYGVSMLYDDMVEDENFFP